MRPYNRLTVHEDVHGARPYSDAYGQATSSTWRFMLNPDTNAIDAALARQKIVGVRLFDPFGDYQGGKNKTFDNEYHHIRTPDEVMGWFLNSEFAKYANNPSVYFIVGQNEPSADNPEDKKKGIAWAVRWGALCVQHGFGALLGGFAVPKSIRLINDGKGYAEAPDIDAGMWDELLALAHNHRAKIVILLHIYTAVREWQELVGSDFRNGAVMLNPPVDKHLKWKRAPNGKYWPQYHMGRDHVLDIRAEELGYNVRFGVGEGLLDNMSDIRHLLEPVEAEFKRTEFADQPFRGIRSLRRLFGHWNNMPEHEYTDEMFGADAFKGMAWWDSEYPANREFLAIYTGDFGRDWITYNLFHDEMKPLLRLIQAHTSTVVEPQLEPVPDLSNVEWVRGRVRRNGVGYTNYRKLPDKNSDDMGDLREWRDFDIAYTDFAEQELWQQEGGPYTWVALKWPDGDVVYVVRKLVVIDVTIDEPAPLPEPIPEPPVEPTPLPPAEVLVDLPLPHLTLTVTEWNRHRLAEYYRTQAHIFSAIADALERSTTPAPSPTLTQIANDVYGTTEESAA